MDAFSQSMLLALLGFNELLRLQKQTKMISVAYWAKLYILLKNCAVAGSPCSVLSSPSFYDNKKKKLGRLKVEEQSLLGGNL